MEDHSFTMLAKAVRERTKTPWEPKLLESFGLVTADVFLTNAGLLFSDDCDVFQSRVFCTKWNINELEKISGLDFFPSLDDTIEEKVEDETDLKFWDIR